MRPVRQNIHILQGSKGNEFLAEQYPTEVFNAIQTNHTDILKRKFNSLEQLSRVMTNDNNIQFYYHQLLASMYPTTTAFGSRTDNYWQLFWTHVAFIKTGNIDNATVLCQEWAVFSCPQGDIALLMALDNILPTTTRMESRITTGSEPFQSRPGRAKRNE